jgi:antiviral helicase SLH1
MIIPAARAVPLRETERLIPITELDPLANGCFPVFVTCCALEHHELDSRRATRTLTGYSQLYIPRHIIQMKICSYVVSAFDFDVASPLNTFHSPDWCGKFLSPSRRIPINFCYQGKTDVAMLTILRVIGQHRSASPIGVHIRSTIDRDSFKVIYVCASSHLI